VGERVAVNDANEFGYLASEYIVKDLTKTGIFTLLILGLLLLAIMRLG